MKGIIIFRKKFFLLSVILVLLLLFGNCDSDLTVGIIGDQFGTENAENAYAIMDKAVRKLAEHNPDIILHVGDMVESVKGINTFEDYSRNFHRAVSIMNTLRIPWLVALGDHDVVPPGYAPLSTDRSRENWFLNLSHSSNLPIDSLPYYSFNFSGYHFICLYSLENLHTDPRWGSIFLNEISDKQFNWLKKDLENFRSQHGIIVLIHHPSWYVWSNWARVHRLLRRFPVIAVMAGHYHYDQDDGLIDGIRYLVMGSTGGTIKFTDPNSGGAQEYGIMQLSHRRLVSFTLYEVESDTLLELTLRRTMDRIQALSCMLDNVKLTDKKFPILKNGKDAPADLFSSLEIRFISNPIDIPINISIIYDSSVFVESRWLRDDEEVSGETTINLAPGERSGWANYSNVGQYRNYPALWEGKLNLSRVQGRRESISVRLQCSFQDHGTRWIYRDLNYQSKE